MQKKRRKERLPEMKNPWDSEAEYCSPGSIEQELDMCEEGSLRGDEILHHHGIDEKEDDRENIPLDELADKRFSSDFSESNREGDEESGDEHSSGLQGGEPEWEMQPHIQTGTPGDFNKVILAMRHVPEAPPELSEREFKRKRKPKSKLKSKTISKTKSKAS